jgi:hypothetical protein
LIGLHQDFLFCFPDFLKDKRQALMLRRKTGLSLDSIKRLIDRGRELIKKVRAQSKSNNKAKRR